MDLSIKVLGFKEVPGPLGGSTVEYEVTVSTNIPELIHAGSSEESGKTTFVVGKTFREIEDFQTKVCRKFPKSEMSNFGTEHKLHSEDTEERRIFADKFLAKVADMHPQCLLVLQEFFDCEHQQTCFNDNIPNVTNSPSKDNFDIFEEVREIVHLPDKSAKGSSPENASAKADAHEENDLFFTSDNDSATKLSFESSILSPIESPFFFTPSTYKENDLFESKPEQEMTEIKNPVRHSSLASSGDFHNAYDEIQLLSVDDDISELMEALQRKQDRPSNISKPKPAPKPMGLIESGRPVPLPRKSLQSRTTPDEPTTSVEAFADAFNTSDILNYIEKEECGQDAGDPQLF